MDITMVHEFMFT